MATINPRDIARMAEERLGAIKEEEYQERIRAAAVEREAIKTREREERTKRILAELDAAGTPDEFDAGRIDGSFTYECVAPTDQEYLARMAAKQKRILDLQFSPDRPSWMRF